MESNIVTPNSDGPKSIKIKGEIITAKYHALEKAIIVAIRLPNGEARSCPVFAANHTFHGRPYKDVPAEEIDREMEKTAELYRSRKGSSINLEIQEEQL